MDQLSSEDLEHVEFAPGDILFRENEHSYHFFIMQEGDVEVFKTSPEGAKVPLAVVSEGTSIGEFAMIDRLPRSATAQALTHVKAVRISDQAYQKLLGELPDWAIAVMRTLVDRLRHTNEILRRSTAAVAPAVLREIEEVEYDPDAGTVVDESPFLGEKD